MTQEKKIAVFTGSRAEYGLQFPILRAIAADNRLQYYLMVGGTHYSSDFGETVREIEADGLSIYRDAGLQIDPTSPRYTAECIGEGVLKMSCLLSELKPDFLVVYGDRFESFSALIAATQMNIAAAHIEGGDYTDGGALDDSVRHAMTKLAHLHFTTNEPAAERVRKLGEEPWRIFNVGLPTLDLAADGLYTEPSQLVSEFGLDLARPVILFCQHSVATENDQADAQIAPSLSALRTLAFEGHQLIATYPNSDAGGRIIIRQLESLKADGLPGVHVVPSLGRDRFHGILNVIGRVGRGAMIGNSSAGVKETRAFRCPAVNIGTRQRGRLRAENVIDVPHDTEAILAAVRTCVSDENFREVCRTCHNPYGGGDAGQQVADILATTQVDLRLIQKKLMF
jgi:UDP-hydrolysing UDP-N-acetyl-D-glucosamine 2-epimerase